jgi:hypothetical protein
MSSAWIGSQVPKDPKKFSLWAVLMEVTKLSPKLEELKKVLLKLISPPLSLSSGVSRVLLLHLQGKMDRLRYGLEAVCLDRNW